ncbi:coiled-coil domain-containing protein 154-like isoform X2 [Tubulanus polymorphus]|uniref:coiled-coil domain-containing protein 154-like isoform X2 n=1 Tax=Tubulanus polymorphus TaxID=672921 RepID=UPI003DA60276
MADSQLETILLDSRLSNNQQFPSKFSTLPGIHGRSSLTNNETQLVPYNKVAALEGLEAADRIRQLDTRLAVTEKSNRALLEEVVRLQSELKNVIRRNEDLAREERNSRQQLENSVRGGSDLYNQLAMRLQRVEERGAQERTLIGDLLNQSKTIEQNVLGGQQDLLSKRDLQNTRIQELKNEVDEAMRGKSQLERLCYQLIEDVRMLKAKTENQQLDFASIANELKLRNKSLEEAQRQTLQSVRKNNETQNQAELTTHGLRSQVEVRLSELRDVLLELRNRQDSETSDRRLNEQTIQARLNDLQVSISEQNRRREEAIHALDTMAREKEHAAEAERLRLHNRIAELVEECSRKILSKEIKLREETQEKYLEVERLVHTEQKLRLDYERMLREENERRWESLKKIADDELIIIKESLRTDRNKCNDNSKRLDESVGLLEKQIEEIKKQLDRVITAEIQSRKQHEKQIVERVDNLQDKLSLATGTLQEAIGGVNAKVDALAVRIRKDLSDAIEERQQSAIRQLNDMDTRLLSLNVKISQIEDKLESRIQAASNVMSENIREKVEAISRWQENMSANLKQLQELQTKLPTDVYELNQKYNLLNGDLSARISSEIDNRVSDVESIRRELEKLNAKPSDGPSREDLDNLQASIRKLAESIQTVKTVLGMKIQSEQKLRVDEVKELQDEFDKLKVQLEPFLRLGNQPRLFIKPEGQPNRIEAERIAPPVNKWSLYTVTRWLKWKDLIMKLNQPEKEPPKKDEDDDDSDDDEPTNDEENKDDKNDDKGDDKPNDEDEKDKPNNDEKKDDDNDNKKDDDKKDDDKKDDNKPDENKGNEDGGKT